MNIIGIYKITSPNGEIYIGQSCNIKKRFEQYYTQRCNEQPKLFKSLCKYGWFNHTFEILEECDKSLLLEKESYYQKLFDTLNKGLNSSILDIQNNKRYLTKETRFKMGSGSRNKIANNSKKVKCIISNRIYNSIKECAELNDINYNTLKQKLNGNNKCKSKQFIYLEDEII